MVDNCKRSHGYLSECKSAFSTFFFSCSRPEVKVSIPGGVLQKQIKSAEERQKELQEEIRKKQQALDQMTVGSCTKGVLSRQLRTSLEFYNSADVISNKPLKRPGCLSVNAEDLQSCLDAFAVSPTKGRPL